MYIGADFLIDKNLNLYLSEVNTGVPAGAQEYDFVYRAQYGRPSSVFQKIESISQKHSGKKFFDYINGLPFMDDLRALKIWMDGKGPLPKNPSKALRLEDKWVQYLVLSKSYPMIPTEVFQDKRTRTPFVLKKRYGRGGKGLTLINSPEDLNEWKIMENFYIVQPYLDSSLGPFKMSVRAASFMGQFICMFASLSRKLTSNHGIRFYVMPGDSLRLTEKNFTVREIVQKCWEADIFYKGDIPDYLYHDVYEETIAEAGLIIPERLYTDIQRISASISDFYKDIDFHTLPKSFIEEVPLVYSDSS